jgi:VNT family MFS transporter (synaptic vesicle glycoprotein 2)
MVKKSYQFQIKSLKEKENKDSKNASQNQSLRSLSMRKPKDLKILLNEIWEQTKALCKPPHLKNTVLTCLIQFGLTTSYYTLMIWFPELFYRFEEYEHIHHGKSSSLCEVSSIVVSNGYVIFIKNNGQNSNFS